MKKHARNPKKRQVQKKQSSLYLLLKGGILLLYYIGRAIYLSLCAPYRVIKIPLVLLGHVYIFLFSKLTDLIAFSISWLLIIFAASLSIGLKGILTVAKLFTRALKLFKTLTFFLLKKIYHLARFTGNYFFRFLLHEKNVIINSISTRAKVSTKFALPSVTIPRVTLPELHIQAFPVRGYVLIVGAVILAFVIMIPVPRVVSDLQTPKPFVITDRHGTMLFSAYDDKKTHTPLSSLPPIYLDAVIAAHDPHFALPFFLHRFDLTRRSSERTITETVAYKFAKNTNPILRMVESQIISYKMDVVLSKSTILELYINSSSFGSQSVGLQSAAYRFFGRSAAYLSQKEFIFLASLPVKESIYPLSQAEIGETMRKSQMIMSKLVDQKKLKTNEHTIPLRLVKSYSYKRAPYVVDRVLKDVTAHLEERQIITHGLTVKTTIDLPVQNAIQQLLIEQMTTTSPSQSQDASDGVALVTSPKNGEIFAMIGSANYYDAQGPLTDRLEETQKIELMDTLLPLITRDSQPVKSSASAKLNTSVPFYGTQIDSLLYGSATLTQDLPLMSPENTDNPHKAILPLEREISIETFARLLNSLALPGVDKPLSYMTTIVDFDGNKLALRTLDEFSGRVLTPTASEYVRTNLSVITNFDERFMKLYSPADLKDTIILTNSTHAEQVLIRPDYVIVLFAPQTASLTQAKNTEPLIMSIAKKMSSLTGSDQVSMNK